MVLHLSGPNTFEATAMTQANDDCHDLKALVASLREMSETEQRIHDLTRQFTVKYPNLNMELGKPFDYFEISHGEMK